MWVLRFIFEVFSQHGKMRLEISITKIPPCIDFLEAKRFLRKHQSRLYIILTIEDPLDARLPGQPNIISTDG